MYFLCYYSNVVASRDYVYVGDAVNGIALSINHTPKDACNEIFDIGSGQEPVVMDTVFMILTDTMTKKAQAVNLNIQDSKCDYYVRLLGQLY